jgi:hypothetical protein
MEGLHMSKAAALEEMYLIYKVIRDYLVAGAKLGMRPEYCGGIGQAS